MSDSEPRPLNAQESPEDEDLAESLDDEPTQEEGRASDEEPVEDDQTARSDADEGASGPSLRDAYTSDRSPPSCSRASPSSATSAPRACRR